jgi:hypothetical protein
MQPGARKKTYGHAEDGLVLLSFLGHLDESCDKRELQREESVRKKKG